MSACAFCQRPLPPGEVIFCREDFFALPVKERRQLRAMHVNRQDTKTKVAKCVRILEASKR